MQLDDESLRRINPATWDSEEWQSIRKKLMSGRYDEHVARCVVQYARLFEGEPTQDAFIALNVTLHDGREGNCIRFLRQGLNLNLDRWVKIAIEQGERDLVTEAQVRLGVEVFGRLDKGEETVAIDRTSFRDRLGCKDQNEVREKAQNIAGRWGLQVQVTAEAVKFKLVEELPQ